MQQSTDKYGKYYSDKNVEFSFDPFAEPSFHSRRFRSTDYRCTNAFDIAQLVNNNENMLFVLGHGFQTVFAPNTNNVFLIGDKKKIIRSGSKDDIFLFYGKDTNTKIDNGFGGGRNVLDFSKIETDDDRRPLSIVPSPDKRADKFNITGYANVEATGITEIVGHKNQMEYIWANCQLEKIELKGGGKRDSPDEIYLDTMGPCEPNLSIVLAGRTKIHGGHVNRKITYFIDGQRNSDTLLHLPCPSINNILLRDVAFCNVKVKKLSNPMRLEFDTVSEAGKSVKLSIESTDCLLNATTLRFKDGLVKFTDRNESLVFVKNNDSDIDDDLSHRLRKLSSISAVVYIGASKQHMTLFRSNQIKHNDKDNVLKSVQVFDTDSVTSATRLCPKNSKVNYFNIGGVHMSSRLDITIDCLDSLAKNHILLTNYTKAMHAKGYQELYVKQEQTSNADLVLQVFLARKDYERENIGRIRIKDGIDNDVYRSLDVQIYTRLTFDNNFELRSKDQILNTTKGTILTIRPDQFDRGRNSFSATAILTGKISYILTVALETFLVNIAQLILDSFDATRARPLDKLLNVFAAISVHFAILCRL
uniref:Uncharacterized protein n=1 Tax=Romanomermis culicivorax TaxID=13658 RepID=A0A915HMA2_ROMCU